MVAQLKPWSDEANIIGQKSIGKTAVYLDSTTCYDQECNIGNFFTDAMVHEVINVGDMCWNIFLTRKWQMAGELLNSTQSWKMTKAGLTQQLL